jgi:hypothetical protein
MSSENLSERTYSFRRFTVDNNASRRALSFQHNLGLMQCNTNRAVPPTQSSLKVKKAQMESGTSLNNHRLTGLRMCHAFVHR